MVMPGGLARVSSSLDTPVVSMQRGGGSKDTWVLSNGPVDTSSLQRPRDLPVELNRGETSDLPSRAADHIFWLGRYAERCEHLARVLRCILIRLTGESGAPAQCGVGVADEAVRLSGISRPPARGRTMRKGISTNRGNLSRGFFRRFSTTIAATA